MQSTPEALFNEQFFSGDFDLAFNFIDKNQVGVDNGKISPLENNMAQQIYNHFQALDTEKQNALV